MPHLLVPLDATSTSATIWVGIVGERPSTLELEVRGIRRPLGADWTTWTSHGAERIHIRRILIEGLEPGRRYPMRLLEQGLERGTGTAVTLPERLPNLDEPPLVCLLGSCFAYFSDEAGATGAAYAALPSSLRPHLKFLCGDQVYLDAPFPKFLLTLYSEEDLKAELLATYIATWSQGHDGVGFQQLLRAGATFFGSDDHELWNNAPLATPTVLNTWWPFGDGGKAWRRIAVRLYDTFQTPARRVAFEVGSASFLVIDSRLARAADASRFMESVDLEAVRDWVEELRGPGILVVGQPILVTASGLRGHLFDRGLADFAQYAELAAALLASRHDLVVLTGDFHHGRVAGCRLRSGASLIEVIASPFALVDPRVAGQWREPPGRFPAAPVPGTTRSTVWVAGGYRLAQNHFATLEFSARGPAVDVRVRAWPIPTPGFAPVSSLILHERLH